MNLVTNHRFLDQLDFPARIRSVATHSLTALVVALSLACDGNLYAADSGKPAVIAIRPAFSSQPTDAELMRARVFQEPLVPTGITSPSENRALASALEVFLQRSDSQDVSALTAFLDRYPTSVWRGSLQLNLGFVYYHTARYSACLAAWKDSWNVSRDATEPKAHMMADMALGQLLEMYARLGRMSDIQELLEQTKDRHIEGSATELVTSAKEALWSMQHRPEISFRCGPMALGRIRAAQNLHGPEDASIATSKSTTNGISLLQVRDLSKTLHMNYQMAFRTPGAKVILPAVIHWKLGHYAALIKEVDGHYLAEDPTFRNSVWFSQKTLEEESDGYFLVPPGNLPPGWRKVDDAEGMAVWGKGTPTDIDPSYLTPNDARAKPDCHHLGMADYNMHLLDVSLNIVDTPLRYPTSFGPAVQLTVTYNQRESGQPVDPIPYSNLGQKWTFNWLAYIEEDDPGDDSADVTYHVAGGGEQTYTGYDFIAKAFTAQSRDGTILQRPTTNSYQMTSTDGSQYIFGQPDGSGGATRKLFLTQVIDPYGNEVSLTYDTNLCLTTITDASGLQKHFYYGLTNDIYKVTQVTDPFGRSAFFEYNANGQLTNITDMIGIHSSFSYGDGDFINSMTTPYGTTTFASTESEQYISTDSTIAPFRRLDITDPLGQRERVEYNQDPGVTGMPDSMSEVPAGIDYFNSFIYGRNTFYWDKKAMAEAPGDYSKARITHWLHSVDIASAVGTPESEQAPLESRIWYNYLGDNIYGPGQPLTTPTNDAPTKIARVMDDGSTQLWQYQRNIIGKPIKVADPLGRTTIYDYANNLVDLLDIHQAVGTNSLGVTNTELLAAFTYSTNHLLLTSVDAAGQTNHYGYNNHGQLTAVTNARNEVVTMAYNTTGLMTNITSAVGIISGAVASFTYDGTNRLRTVTDPLGRTVTYDYDSFDRVTRVTYPDNTYDETVYQFLDPVFTKDRRGHWSAMQYDALRRRTDTYDSIARHTHFEYCSCGALASATDPLGRTTTWLRDLEGRVATKIFPNETEVNYMYETNAGRLKMITDAMNQSTIYNYFNDGDVQSVTFSNALIATPNVSFTYDTNYNRLTSMIDGIGTTAYSYYSVTNGQLGAGMLESVDGPFANDTITYTYDELGRVSSRGINGVAQQLTYDALGRVTMVTNALGSFTNVYLGATGLIATNFYPNGQQTVFSYLGVTNDERLAEILNLNHDGSTLSKFDYGYDADGQITNWTEQADANTPTVKLPEYDPVDQLLALTVRSNSVAGAILQQFVYGYDSAGNRTGQTIGTGSAVSTISNGYNSMNQVTNIGSGGVMRFSGHLDELGMVTVAGTPASVDSRYTNFVGYATVTTGSNVIPIVATDYSGNSRTNKYQVVVTNSINSQTLHYDANGNLTNDGAGITYEYDAVNRTVAIDRGLTNRTEFLYDGLGRRVQEIEMTNGVAYVTNKFIWSELEPCEQRDYTGSTLIKRFFGYGERISGTNYFFTRDHLGSVREVTDNSGSIEARYNYSPYGTKTKTQGTLDADFGYTGCFMFASQPEHTFTLFRVYRPDVGRWTSRDPLAEDGGFNLYDYVLNNPINFIDLLGLTLVTSPDWFPGATDVNENGDFTMNVNDGSDATTVLKRLTQAQLREEEQRTADRLKNFEEDWGKKDRRAEGTFDTRFFKGVCKDRDYYYVEDMDRIYADNEINYLGIGMYESWLGDSELKADAITWLWKQQYPGPIPSGTWYWLHRGYDDYPNMSGGSSSGSSGGSSGLSGRRR